MSRNTSLHLTEKEHSFIINIAKQCANNGGSGVSEGAIVRTMVRLLQKLDVNVSGVKTEDQLLARLQNAVNKF